jgi:hypothetical protein
MLAGLLTNMRMNIMINMIWNLFIRIILGISLDWPNIEGFCKWECHRPTWQHVAYTELVYIPDFCIISNFNCKNWRGNLLLLSTRKPRLRRNNSTVNFGALANVSSLFLPTSLIFSRLFHSSRASLFSIHWKTSLNKVYLYTWNCGCMRSSATGLCSSVAESVASPYFDSCKRAISFIFLSCSWLGLN